MQADFDTQEAQSAAAIVATNGRLAYLVNGLAAQLDLAAELIERHDAADKAFEHHKVSALGLAIHAAVEGLDAQAMRGNPVVADFFGLAA